ncbi:MAG: ABC transporter ATP-binding protein [Capsulimonadaceae bacterium]
MKKSSEVKDLLWPHMLAQLPLLAMAMLCSVVLAITSLGPTFVTKSVIDSMIARNAVKMNEGIVIIVVSYALRWPASYLQTVWFAEASQRFSLGLRQQIYRHLQSLSLSFFNRQRTGALMSTMTNDAPILQGAISGLKDLAPAPFTAVGALCFAFSASWILTLGSLIMVPVMIVTINTLTGQIKRMTTNTQDKVSDVNVMMEETLSGIRIIQSFSAEKHEMDRFSRENIAAKDLSMLSIRRQAQLKPAIDLIGAVAVALALAAGGHLIVNGTLTVGALMKFVVAMNQLGVAMSNMGSARSTWEQVLGAGERIVDNVIAVQSEIQDMPDAEDLATTEGRIGFEDVSFAYNAETHVLSNITFTIEPGEVVAVVGASGAGKSTLADLIPRFYDPGSGRVTVDGRDIRALTLASLRAHIGIVPQETVLFGGTIRDNIAYGNPAATDAMVEQAARAANAHDFIVDGSALPDGYNTIVGERGKQVSGGQRQRIAIARALLKNPRILILDEATSSLDAQSEILVQEALDKLMKGRSTLVIAHRLSTIINANKIIVMQKGRIVETGTHSDLIRIPGGVYAGLYDTQFHWEPEDPLNGAAAACATGDTPGIAPNGRIGVYPALGCDGPSKVDPLDVSTSETGAGLAAPAGV